MIVRRVAAFARHRQPGTGQALIAVAALLATVAADAAPSHIEGPGDRGMLIDPTRPVTRISGERFDLSYYTAQPAPTRVQVRRGDLPFAARKLAGRMEDPWVGSGVRTIEGPSGERTQHRISVRGLEPGGRYFYRVFDPATDPTSEETRWGAQKPWRREYSVSTPAGAGHRTLVRYPVKVLLMPNVINVESAHADPASPATRPEKLTDAQLALVREELDRAARFFFVNSGMRLWVDFAIAIDDRWQRWGPEPGAAEDFYKSWPMCRSYAGQDYHQPGGGDFTAVDLREPHRVLDGPIVEDPPFYGQVEIAFPRRWEPGRNQWTFYASGGGTLGVDSVPDGLPGRSQFFGGYDTAWLTTHEVHHQLESLGRLSLADREDERIVYNHWSPRSRSRGPDAASGPEGSKGVYPWTTSDRHGEHYDGMAFWDRTLSDSQWLRMHLVETVVVADTDDDGFPDDDARLPLDERRFGSDPAKARTDGRTLDIDKAMLSTWAPAPLQARFDKPMPTFARPDPTHPDSDRDGWDDDEDPYPLIPREPFVYPFSATIDGDAAEWLNVPLGGAMAVKGPENLELEFRQGHDAAAYSGLIRARGEWAQIRIVIDGEGLGVYSSDSTQALRILNGDEIRVDHKDRFFPRAPGLRWAASRGHDGWDNIEFGLPNMGDGLMYWRGAGREVGTYIEITDSHGYVRSVHEPYRLFYCRMLERPGKDPMPANPPSELAADGARVVVLKPDDARLRTRGAGWKVENGVYRHSGPGEDAIYLENISATDFDLWARLEARSDAILGAFVAGSPMSATSDYVAFVGGYANTRSRLRLFGAEEGDTAAIVAPGLHSMQLSRRGGVVWCLWDGQPILWAVDPEPTVVIDRLAILGGYGGRQGLHEIRFRSSSGINSPTSEAPEHSPKP